MSQIFQYPPTALDLVQLFPAALLILVSPVALLLAYGEVLRYWRAADVRLRFALAGAVGGALVLRWLVAPWLLATIFMGYRWTQLCIDLFPVSHYGIGAQAFYHALLRVLPHDHLSIIAVNAAIGVATLPLAATVAARVLASPGAGVAAAWLIALAPIFVRNDTSDANNVPILLWWFGGTVLWFSYLERARSLALAGAVALLSLAAVSRPEMLGLVPLVVAALTAADRPLAPLLRRREVRIAVAAALALTAVHVVFVLASIVGLRDRASLPGFTLLDPGELLYILRHTCAVTDFGIYPASYAALAVAAFAAGRQRLRRHLALGACVLLAIYVYVPDLDYANFARVHVPAALFFTFLAASGFDALWTRWTDWRWRLALVAVTLVALPHNWNWLYRPTNEAQEERFIIKMLAELPADGPFLLVTFGREDRSDPNDFDWFTHEHFPAYQVVEPARRGRVLSMSEFLERPQWQEKVYFYHGMRCYASFRPGSVPPPSGDGLRRVCAAMRENFDLKPIFEEVVPNHGDVWIKYYGLAPTLRIGLYEVRPRAAE